jgi:hypothetical protein
MRYAGQYGRDNSQHDQRRAKSDCTLMQTNALGRGRFLLSRYGRMQRCQSEGGHSQRRPDPGKRGPVQRELVRKPARLVRSRARLTRGSTGFGVSRLTRTLLCDFEARIIRNAPTWSPLLPSAAMGKIGPVPAVRPNRNFHLRTVVSQRLKFLF